MSGVTVGSRLEQLEELRARIEYEIAAERRRVAISVPNPPPARVPKLTEVNRVDVRLAGLGVTSRQVKEWAVDAGLLDHVHRGRVAAHLVEMFAEARERLNECIRVEA
jgi:hypothetical protein